MKGGKRAPKKRSKTAKRLHDLHDGEPSLQTQMGLSDEIFESVHDYLLQAARQFLDGSRQYRKQTHEACEAYITAVAEHHVLKQFEACWPAVAYAKIYLNNRVKFFAHKRRKENKTRTQQSLVTRSTRASSKNMGSIPPASENLKVTPRSAMTLVPFVLVPERSNGRRGISASAFSQSTDKPSRQPAPLPSSSEPHPRSLQLQNRSSHPPDVSITQFLLSLDPPQPRLNSIFAHAGVDDASYLRALAKDSEALTEFLKSLEEDGKLKRVQISLIKSAIVRTFASTNNPP